MKKQVIRQMKIIMALLLAILLFPKNAEAEEKAVFHVQSAEVKEDGTISISVYLTDTVNLGGLDAELVYDASKVTYIGSGLGNSFRDGYGETTHAADSAKVKCVLVYPETKAAHGELMYATFRLNNGAESYQPEFRVIDLLDGSNEVQPISYSITYQQVDGNWLDVPDASGQKASGEIIAEAREAYGAKGDPERRLEETVEGEKSAEEIMEESEQSSGNKEIDSEGKNETKEGKEEKEEIEKKEETKAEKSGKTAGKENKSEKDSALPVLCIVTFVIIIAALCLIKRKKLVRK